jgi:serine/threonine protein kinase
MELIEGTRIDSYCDERRLPVTERLRLFRHICAAVQYAHQRLVIHRDLKPSNILVIREGSPKLLDFGIAKILDRAHGARTTRAGPMTPEYASPEQVRGDAITTASDVYALGIVLYGLLTGRSPYPCDTRSPLELSRAVCETEPGRPSAVVVRPPLARDADGGKPSTPEELSGCREGSATSSPWPRAGWCFSPSWGARMPPGGRRASRGARRRSRNRRERARRGDSVTCASSPTP